MKKIIFLLVILFFTKNLLSQLGFTVKTGSGSFLMKDPKAYNQYLINNYPVKVKQISNFPDTKYIEAEGYYVIKRLSLGFVYGYLSTGSRLSYKDYSGSITFDQISSSMSIGLVSKLKWIDTKWVKSNFYISPQSNSTIHKMDENVLIVKENFSQSISLTSRSFSISYGIELTLPIKMLEIGAFIGNCHDYKDALKKENNKLLLNQKSVFSDWSGIRYGLMLTYLLHLD